MGRIYSNGTVFIETKERAVKNFWKKVLKTESCWVWTASKDGSGYGIFGTGRFGSKRAHRFSWELIKEKIPTGFELCHKCDNPACVNPDHLFIGTHTDNMRDASNKNKFPLRYGLDHPRGKLSDEQVVEIVKKYNEGIPIRKICFQLDLQIILQKVPSGIEKIAIISFGFFPSVYSFLISNTWVSFSFALGFFSPLFGGFLLILHICISFKA